MIIGKHVKDTIRLLNEKPHEWIGNRYTINHSGTGIGIWYCNGLFFMKFYGKYEAVPVNFFEKWALKRATKRWQRVQPLMTLKKALERA